MWPLHLDLKSVPLDLEPLLLLLLQNYSHASDHRIVNNHAMLMLGGRFENTVVMMADADEFFVPQVG